MGNERQVINSGAIVEEPIQGSRIAQQMEQVEWTWPMLCRVQHPGFLVHWTIGSFVENFNASKEGVTVKYSCDC